MGGAAIRRPIGDRRKCTSSGRPLWRSSTRGQTSRWATRTMHGCGTPSKVRRRLCMSVLSLAQGETMCFLSEHKAEKKVTGSVIATEVRSRALLACAIHFPSVDFTWLPSSCSGRSQPELVFAVASVSPTWGLECEYGVATVLCCLLLLTLLFP